VRALDFCINPGFEIADVVAGLPGPYGANTAHPWSYWGNSTGLVNCNPANPQAAVANPFIDANNPSARVWANFNNPFYVNVASQNNFTYSGDPAGLRRPLTGFVLIPGVKYTFTGQFYVPSSQIIPGTTQARAGMYLSMAGSGTTPAQPGNLRALDPRYYENAGVEPPLPIFVPQQSPVSATIPLDQWHTITVDYVFPTTFNTFDAAGVVTGTYNTVPQIVNYPSFRIFGGDGARYLGIAAGTPPAKPLVDVPNPGGYFDNCQISSSDYRNDLHGLVKDNLGNPVGGATVTLTSPFITTTDVVTTLSDGSYTMPTWAPFGYTYSVNATKDAVTGDGPKSLLVSSTAGEFPLITITLPSAYATWAAAQVPPVTGDPSEDSNNDGVANGVAYFMNKAGLATNAGINGSGQVTWPNGGNIASSAYGTQFVVQTSSDLQTWTNVDAVDLDTNSDYIPGSAGPPSVPPVDGSLSYTLTGASPQFVRLKVTPY
jgi:hypothetical protein